jgi:hypothetical protein
MAECKLSLANGKPDTLCDEDFCLFWRAVDQIGVAQGEWSGCAIQHFALLDGGDDVAAWLISAKQRVAAGALLLETTEVNTVEDGDPVAVLRAGGLRAARRARSEVGACAASGAPGEGERQ